MTARRSAESGRVSPFLAIAFSGLLAVIGLTYDAAGQIRTLHTAQLLAAEAGRTAGQAVDLDLVLAGGSHRIEQSAAEQAAQAYLAGAGDDVQLSEITFNPELTEVTVTVTGTYQPLFLSLFGAGSRQVTGSATVTLISG